jgi:ketosteroid isomerase-like protein
MTREQTLALINDLLIAARRGDIDRLRDLYAPDAVAISPMFGEVHGAARIASTWATLISTFNDLATSTSHVLVDGDRVAVLSEVAATDRYGWFGRPPTGGPITYKLVLLFTVAGGQIVRDERIYDSAGVVDRLEKLRLDKELRTAADVQRMLLPRTEHVNRFSESVGDSWPCRAIGGDFFEIVECGSDRMGLAMGDVAGKGPAAALLASMLQGMLATEVRAGDGPAAMLSRINRGLSERHLEARFATVVFAALSADGRLVYANAGHNPPALVRRGRIERLVSGGPILGVFADASFEETALRLDPLDTLVMFTDGVTEARNRGAEEFGEERLLDCLRRHVAESPPVLLRSMFAAVRDFADGAEPADDITMTVTRFGPNPGPAGA